MLGIIFVGALLAGAATATGNCPPTLRVVATSHRDAGLQVGAHFRTMIQDRFSRSAQLPKLRAFAATAGGFAALESLLAFSVCAMSCLCVHIIYYIFFVVCF